MCNVGSRCDIWLWDVLHVVIHGIHVVYVARVVAATVFGEVARFSAVEAWSFGLRTAVVLLCRGAHCVTVRVITWLCRDGIGVYIVTLVLALIVGCPSVG
jgi:hypothetical protein